MSGLFGQKTGPGGLSINTGSANSLFASNNNNLNPNTTSQPQSGGLFGSATAKPGGLFGSSATTSASAGTLFGTTTAATTQSGSLFGNTAVAPASKAGTLFGGAASTQSSVGGLFGSQITNTQPQQSSQPGQQGAMSGSSLFGNNTSQPQQSSGLFGNTASQSQAQQSSGLFGSLGSQPQRGSIFGSLGGQTQQPQQQQQAGASLFGSLNQNQNQGQQTGSLFGSQKPSTYSFAHSTPNTQRNMFSSQSASTLFPSQQPQRSVFSASIGQYTAAAQSVPGVRIDLSNLRPTTRFEDLHETLQQEIASLDSFILNQMSAADDCASALPRVAGLTKTIPPDVEYCERKLEAAQNSLETDAAAIDSAKQLVRSDAEDARRSFKAIHALRLPAQFHSGGLWNSSTAASVGGPSAAPADLDKSDAENDSIDLVKYFAAQAEEMQKRLDGLTRNLSEVESYLGGIEAQTIAQMQSLRMGRASLDGGGGAGGAIGAAGRTKEDKIRELTSVLREFESGILIVAGHVGGAREAVQELMLADANVWPVIGRQR